MNNHTDQIDLRLIQRALAGDQESQTRLIRRAEPRLHRYLYRLTLDPHIAEDLCQETLMALFKARSTLSFEHPHCLWARLYRTGLSQVQKHYRPRGNQRLKYVSFERNESYEQLSYSEEQGYHHLINQELRQAVMHAVAALKLHYRNVLTLRCFDNLSYAEIATVLGISENQAHIRFFRAKQALRHKLNQRGIKKDALLPALTTFAYATLSNTAPTEAAPLVSQASLTVGWRTMAIATLTSKTMISGFLLLLMLIPTVLLLPSKSNDSGSTLTVSPSLPTPPVFDSSISLIFDDPQSNFSTLTQVTRTNHPGGKDWKHFVWWPQLEPVRLLKSAIDTETPNDMFILSQDEWLEYEFPRDIQNHAGPEIAIQVLTWSTQPSFFVTDGHELRLEIYPTGYLGSYPLGKSALTFDLMELDCSFPIRGLRILGNNNGGPYQGCGLGRPQTLLQPIDPIFSDKQLLDHD